jgi:GMP synthase-like glutamine amidotransferase
MKPVAIFRHFRTEGPARLGEFLTAHAIPWILYKLDEGESVPVSVEPYSGLVFMGGPMSVNDELPWIPPLLEFIRAAVAAEVPVLGHCLGSQLMAKALGARVTGNPVKEIGWGPVFTNHGAAARHWFGSLKEFEVFHWHGQTWELPEGASLLAGSPHCPHQAFSLGPHLGMQFHVEMTEDYIREWCRVGRREIAGSQSPAVQPVEAILAQLPDKLPLLNQVADMLYGIWIQELKA